MKFEKYIVVLLVFAALLTASFSIQEDMGEPYGVTITGESEVSGITAVDEMNEIGEDIQSKILGLSEKVSSFDPTAIYDVAGLFLDVGAYLLKIPNAFLQSLEISFTLLKIPIPIWFTSMILTIIVIIAVFAALKIFLKRETI